MNYENTPMLFVILWKYVVMPEVELIAVTPPVDHLDGQRASFTLTTHLSPEKTEFPRSYLKVHTGNSRWHKYRSPVPN